MIVKYNMEQLNRIIDDIFSLTGISIEILDIDYNSVIRSVQKQKYCSLLQTMESEKKRCIQCDIKILDRCRFSKKMECHICRAGLYDSAMPIMKDNIIAGFIIMGQVRSASSPDLPKYLPHVDPKILRRLDEFYGQIPFISPKRLEALYDLLPCILFDNAIEIVYDSFVNEAVKYIEANLQEDLSINQLCSKFYVSKNYLYESFRKHLDNTVNGYINEQRISKAKELLVQSNAPVYQVAETVGIYNYTYFCKLFKKCSGVTPTEYRKCSTIIE